MLEHAHLRIAGDAADFDGIEPPLLEYAEDFLFAALLRHQQHALLRLAQHDFVRRHAGFALRHAIEFDLDAGAAAPAHLAGGAGQAGGAHVLNADDGAGLHGFEAGFEQQLFEERVADLHVGPLGLGGFAEFLAGHGAAVDAVAAGLGADVDDGIALAGGARVKDLVAPDQPEREGIDQRIAGVARLELGLAAEVGHAKAVAVGGDAADHAFHDRVILVDLGLCRDGALPRLAGQAPLHTLDRPKAQRVHHRDRPRAHGEDVAQDPADAGRRALERLDERWVVVRLNLEGAGPAVADINDAGIFAGTLHHELAAGGQAFQMNPRRLVGAMLAPHHAEDAEFGAGGLAAAQQLLDLFVFFGRQAVFPDDLRRNGGNRGGGHARDVLLSHLNQLFACGFV